MTVTNLNVTTSSALGNGGSGALVIGFTYKDHLQLLVSIQDETDPLNITKTAQIFSPYNSIDPTVLPGHFKIPQPQDQPSWSTGEHGASVLLGSIPSANQRIVIDRVTPLTQPIVYDASRPPSPALMEGQEDRLVMMMQEVSARSIVAATEAAGAMALIAAGGITGPVGPAGPAGAAGPAGPAGSTIEVVADMLDAAYTVLAADQHIRSTTVLTADRAVLLPPALIGIKGRVIKIKNLPTQAHNLIPTANGADRMDGLATITVPPGFDAELICGAAGVWDIRG